MNKIISLAVLMMSVQSFAFESKMTLSMVELKKNSLIVRASAGQDDQIYATASRVIQLQLQASKCERVGVSPNSMKAVKEYVFTITSDNCVVKNKKTENCDSGFEARNIAANVNNPDDVIVGEDLYKVCVQSMLGGKPASEFDMFKTPPKKEEEKR